MQTIFSTGVMVQPQKEHSTNGRTGHRNQSRFLDTLWNKYEAVLNDEFMTTNSAEGYNYGLASALPANSETWTIIACLKAEEASAN